ncbi:phosphoglucosamine mutase [bacterium]|nr:phosphoglucosamine mutase [bacterium]
MKLFGTDGVRGRVGSELTAEIAFKLGRAAAGHFLERGVRRVVIARDTRISGEMLAGAFLSGASSVGLNALDLGIAPTPAVSALLSSIQHPASSFGVVISASHNPYPDNGIKIFSPDGSKLSVGEEEAIERRIKSTRELDAGEDAIGQVLPAAALVDEYVGRLKKMFPLKLTRTALVIDAAHGAWGPHARKVFDGIAPEVTFLNCDFTGVDINENCGSTRIETLDEPLKSAIRNPQSEIPIGLAFDGDCDRTLIRIANLNPKSEIHNPKCQTLDGDAMLFLFAKHLVTEGPVVGTVMTNGALIAALEKLGRPFHRAPVGDREVFELMSKNNAGLGGEQSGHIIFGATQKTGDGALTALSFLKVFAENYHESLEDLRRDIPEPFPQKLVNLRVSKKIQWEDDAALSESVRAAKEKLGPHGRLVIRYSGTEPLLRLMAEAPSIGVVEDQLDFLCDRFRSRLSGENPNLS